MKRTVIAPLILMFAAMSTLIAEPATQFAKANQEYTAGDFKATIGDYEELLRAGEDTPNLFYNLGNAYFRQRDFGRAILNYERALVLEPRHPEAQANLRLARDEARALELMPNRWEYWLTVADSNEYAITVVIAFWFGAFTLVIFVFNKRRSAFVLTILSLFVAAVAILALYELQRGKSGPGLAIVITDNTEARIATADTANRVLVLPAGSEIKIASRRGDWIYAELPNNLRGWMPATSAEPVRM